MIFEVNVNHDCIWPYRVIACFLQNEMKNNANSWNNKNFVKFEHWFNAENQMNNISAKNVLYVLCLSQHILLLKYSLLIDIMFLRTNASINHKVNVKVRFKVICLTFLGLHCLHSVNEWRWENMLDLLCGSLVL